MRAHTRHERRVCVCVYVCLRGAQNCSQPAFCDAPWGGFKRSGIGRDNGPNGMLSYTEPKQCTTYVSENPLGWYTMPSKL